MERIFYVAFDDSENEWWVYRANDPVERVESLGAGQSFCDRFNSLEAENARLKAILDGDPNQTETDETRRAWRHSAVVYADKVEAENAALREVNTAMENVIKQGAADIKELRSENAALKARCDRQKKALSSCREYIGFFLGGWHVATGAKRAAEKTAAVIDAALAEEPHE